MKRRTTNIIRKIMDEFIPPVIRDSRWFMYPFFWYWFKRKNLSLYMDFKKRAWRMTESEFADYYKNLDCRATDRPTDLNKECISMMLEKLNAESTTLLDVGCGRGYWLSVLKQKTNLDLTGCDLFEKDNLEGIKYTKGNIENLPFADNSFDIVTCCHTIEHIRDIKKAITELKRVAKKQVIIVTPKQRYYYYTLDLHLHFFPVSEYLTQLAGLNNFECTNCKGDWCYIANI